MHIYYLFAFSLCAIIQSYEHGIDNRHCLTLAQEKALKKQSMILGKLKMQPAPQRPIQASVLDFNSVPYFACCSIFCSCLPPPQINKLIRSLVIFSTADTTEHQVQGGLLWGALSITPVKVGMHNCQETSSFYIPGQFKWLATLQSLMLRFLGIHHEKLQTEKK